MVSKKTSFRLFLLVTIFSVTSCGVWQNFTTYFNLYYNTSSIFEDAETEILTQKRDIFSNDPLVIPGTARNNLIKVIEKSSKILQFNSESAYVDEALMMLGKSFYYQSNFQKAKRKFQELLVAIPDEEDKIIETKLWIAKCNLSLKENSEGLKLLDEVRTASVEQGLDEVVEQSYVEEIKYYLREEQYAQAISLANEFVEVYDDDEVIAKVYYELGNLYTTMKQDQDAIASYEKVFDYAPDFDLEVAATIKLAKALRAGGEDERALEEFEDMRNSDKFSTSYNEIDLEIGKTLRDLNRFQEARDQLVKTDTLYKNTPFSAAASFELGELYRYNLSNYDTAAAYFKKAFSSNPPKEYMEPARVSNLLFIKYGRLRKEIDVYDRQLYYAKNPDIFKKDSSDYVEDSLKILDDFLAKKELQEIWSNVDNPFNKPDSLLLKDSSFIKDSIFIKDSLTKVDSLIKIGMMSESDTIGLMQNLIKLTKKDSLDSNNQLSNRDRILKQAQGQLRLDTVKFKNNPPRKPKVPIDSVETILAKNRLELGNLFLTEINVPDSAFKLYTEILERYPDTRYYPNTLYALGSYYLTVDNKESADSLFRIIYDEYKNRSIVNAAADKLGLPFINQNSDPAKDLYASAEDQMLQGNYSVSVSDFFNIYRRYPVSPIAPQALYTTGFILENDLFMLDSAAAVYDTLVAKYPASVYVKQVSKKLTAYKQEKIRRQKEISDSLNNITKPIAVDSLQLAEGSISEDSSLIVNQAFNNEQVKETNVAKNEGELETGIVVVPLNVNPGQKKKLEPLWDPRKHRQ